ncbi:hypothetical protein FLA_2049 [Filimonas lacunae]|nr:hypothetical protein FLA_2049 [Filimonas lacunae]
MNENELLPATEPTLQARDILWKGASSLWIKNYMKLPLVKLYSTHDLWINWLRPGIKMEQKAGC